jgi:hypothetical protein
VILAYSLVCIAVGLLLAHFALIGLIPAQPGDWLAERIKRAAAVVWLALLLVGQLFGRKAT